MKNFAEMNMDEMLSVVGGAAGPVGIVKGDIVWGPLKDNTSCGCSVPTHKSLDDIFRDLSIWH